MSARKARKNRRLAAAHRVVEAQRAVAAFRVDDRWCASRAVEQAMKEAEAAFAVDDHECASHLAEVVLLMCRRELPKFRADPEAWMARLQELAA